MMELCQRPINRGDFYYLGSIKAPQTYYYHEFDDIVDTHKDDDGVCIISMNTLLHCFYDGDNKVYFLDSKGNIRMWDRCLTTHEFYMDFNSVLKGKSLKEPTIKKFIKKIKEWYDYE